MCHEPDSRPPAPPVVGEVASSGPVQLTAADGTVLAAHEAVPAGPVRGRVVILPDIRGLHPYYQALAERFAQAGVHALAIDYFARTAGPSTRGEDFDWQAHVPLVTPDQVRLDTAAALAHLTTGGGGAAVTVGFCFGGGHSWALAASDLDLGGAIGFYGRPALLEAAGERVHRPLLMLVAGADHAIPAPEVVALADRLRSAGKDVEAHVYDGAPHSFFDRSFADHAQACDDAWRRMLAFLDRVA